MRCPENPAAFPYAVPSDFHAAEIGMSMRDHFAGQALPSVALLCRADTGIGDSYEAYCAERAYRFADAMLAERAKATGAAA